jgi:hypothetical protein
MSFLFYPTSQITMGYPMDNALNAPARCRPKFKADNRVVAEDGCFNGTTGLPVGSILK